MKPTIRLAATALLFLSTPTFAWADTITLRADTWCPYNCEPGSERPGYMVEIAREALRPYGHSVEYDTLNWLRSIDKARRGEVSGVIGAVQEEVEGFVMGPPLGPLADGIVLREGETVELDRDRPFEGLRIGAVQGYEYFGPLSDHIERNRNEPRIVQFVHGEDALERNLRKLKAGRIDVVAEDVNVLRHRIATEAMDGIRIVNLDVPESGYIAFSPNHPKSQIYAAQMAQGLARLRASGRLARIMSRYSLPVWN